MADYTKGICVECGAIYNETKYSFLCPKCQKEHLRKNAKKIGLSELGLKARKERNNGWKL